MTAGPIDRSMPPAGGAPRPFSFPAFERRRLANGLELFLAPLRRMPLIDLQLSLPAGAVHNPGTAPGLAHLTASVLDEGTRRRSSEEIASTVERLGGYLATGADWDTLQISCGLLARHLDTGLELVAEIARQPVFPETEVARLRGQLLAEIARRGAQPAAVADDQLAAAIYGDSVYGRPRIGTADSIGALQRSDLRDFYGRHGTAGGGALILTGDFDPRAATRHLSELFEDWTTAAAPADPRPDAPRLAGIEVTLVDRDGVQTELRLGHRGPPRSHPDFFPLAVLNSILGGKFMSRINLNLRERHGYTYGASSFFSWRRGPGPFIVSTAVENRHAAAAAREILHEIERLRREPVSAEELEETKSYLTGVFPYSTQRLEGVTARLRGLAVFDLPDDYYDTYAARIAAVSAEDLLGCARRHLEPDRLAIVAVGPAGALRDGLADLGAIRIVAS